MQNRSALAGEFFPGFAHDSAGDGGGDRLFDPAANLLANLRDDALGAVVDTGRDLLSDGRQRELDTDHPTPTAPRRGSSEPRPRRPPPPPTEP